MTRPVEEFEISALLDGELDEPRAAEVRAAIQQDPALRAQYERLAAADQAWGAAARSARFQPVVTLEPAPACTVDWSRAIIVASAALGAVLRLISKMVNADLIFAMLPHALLLTVAIIFIVWLATHDRGEQGGVQLDGPAWRSQS